MFTVENERDVATVREFLQSRRFQGAPFRRVIPPVREALERVAVDFENRGHEADWFLDRANSLEELLGEALGKLEGIICNAEPCVCDTCEMFDRAENERESIRGR